MRMAEKKYKITNLGFTLVELVAVIAILGIVALITVISVMGIYEKTSVSLSSSQTKIIEEAAKKWIMANSGVLPTDGKVYVLGIEQLVNSGYLDDSDIYNPKTKKKLLGHINIFFDNSTNQYKVKLVNEEIITKKNILDNNEVFTAEHSDISGLYTDAENAERYIFKGSNPNNYITFNNELWRIVSIEADGTIKIINDSGHFHIFDNDENRTLWANSGISDVDNSELFTYLNTDYYLTLKNNKKYIAYGKWCAKYLSITGNESSDFLDEQFSSFCDSEYDPKPVSAYVGMINIKEIRETSLGTCQYKSSCTDTYLTKNSSSWTLNYTQMPLILNNQIDVSPANNPTILVRPMVYLDANIELFGEGTSSNPYKIK